MKKILRFDQVQNYNFLSYQIPIDHQIPYILSQQENIAVNWIVKLYLQQQLQRRNQHYLFEKDEYSEYGILLVNRNGVRQQLNRWQILYLLGCYNTFGWQTITESQLQLYLSNIYVNEICPIHKIYIQKNLLRFDLLTRTLIYSIKNGNFTIQMKEDRFQKQKKCQVSVTKATIFKKYSLQCQEQIQQYQILQDIIALRTDNFVYLSYKQTFKKLHIKCVDLKWWNKTALILVCADYYLRLVSIRLKKQQDQFVLFAFVQKNPIDKWFNGEFGVMVDKGMLMFSIIDGRLYLRRVGGSKFELCKQWSMNDQNGILFKGAVYMNHVVHVLIATSNRGKAYQLNHLCLYIDSAIFKIQ